MIRTLQRRFILSAMSAVTVLLAVLLAAINIGNVYTSNKQNNKMLGALLSEETMMQPPPKHDAPKNFFDAPSDANFRMSAVYFTVKVDRNNEIFEIITDRIADVSESDARGICQTVIDEGKPEGKIRNFLYRASVNERNGGTVYLFLDTTAQQRNILLVVLYSLSAGIICWFAMLLFVIFISKMAIRPIAENIARQKQFVTDAGHEIKTPLAIILANTEAMELYEGENKWSRNIREQTLRLYGLMQNLLTLARADEGRGAVRCESLSLSSEVAETLKTFEESIKLKGLSLSDKIDENVTVNADKEQLRRLLSILMDNAVKYSPEAGEIGVRLERRGKNAVLNIRNQCEKLPECPPEKLFDRFFRADTARTQEKGGYGIGLSSAKTIVELFGGTIKAEYCQPDQIEFTVTL